MNRLQACGQKTRCTNEFVFEVFCLIFMAGVTFLSKKKWPLQKKTLIPIGSNNS
jgi:hypothetical protein